MLKEMDTPNNTIFGLLYIKLSKREENMDTIYKGDFGELRVGKFDLIPLRVISFDSSQEALTISGMNIDRIEYRNNQIYSSKPWRQTNQPSPAEEAIWTIHVGDNCDRLVRALECVCSAAAAILKGELPGFIGTMDAVKLDNDDVVYM